MSYTITPYAVKFKDGNIYKDVYVMGETVTHDSQAWAEGTRNGAPVPGSDPTSAHNSKYWQQQAATQATAASNSAAAAAASAAHFTIDINNNNDHILRFHIT